MGDRLRALIDGSNLFAPCTQTLEALKVLKLICPLCRHEHADDLECLDSGRADTIRCENPNCDKRFTFLVRECLACGEESVFTWGGMPAPEALAALFCEHCGVTLNEVPQETEGESATQRVQ
jgi:transcription elongation factor Elf1